MLRKGSVWGCATLALFCLACGGDPAPAPAATSAGEIVTPPFPVRGDLADLSLTWFDEEGAHTAATRHEIPEARRGEVRVDSLEIAPDDRDPDHVFVADLSAPSEGGTYVVRQMRREDFDHRVETFGDAAAGSEAAGAAVASSEIIVFGASWCGACRQAEAFFRARNIPFIERDVENEPGAREDMQRRAQAAGIRPTGIPVIDVRGRVTQGFNPEAIERALRETAGAAGSGTGAAPVGGGTGISI